MLNIDSKTNKITIINGDTGIIHIQIDNYQLKEGDVLRFTVKSNAHDDEEIIKKDIDTFDTANPDGYFLENGSCIILLKSEDTQLEKAGTYFYDIQVNLSDGRIDTIIGPCKFIINKGVTERY